MTVTSPRPYISASFVPFMTCIRWSFTPSTPRRFNSPAIASISSRVSPGIHRTVVVVTPINQFQASVVHGLNAKLQPEVGLTGKLLEKLQDVIRQAVGAGGDDQSDYVGNGECFGEQLPQVIDRCIGVGIGLKIGDEF